MTSPNPAGAASRLATIRRMLGPAVIELAYHAAVPAVLDVGLLHLLRINFFLDPPRELPYHAESALLLSPLVRDLGGGLYEIEPDVRELLIAGLTSSFDEQRLTQIAVLLDRYATRNPSWRDRPELVAAQRVTAVGIVSPDRTAAWLADDHHGSESGGALPREWFVAMRAQFDIRPDPSRTFDDAVFDATRELRDGSAAAPLATVRLLGEVALLPGAEAVDVAVSLDGVARSRDDAVGRNAGTVAAGLRDGADRSTVLDRLRLRASTLTGRLGVDHPETITVLQELAELLRAHELPDEERATLTALIQGLTLAYGERDPRTVAASERLRALGGDAVPVATPPPMNSGQARRRLTERLRGLRISCGLTQAQVADDLEWSISKVMRIESGAVGLSETDLRAMLQLYGVTDAVEVEETAAVGRAARQRSTLPQHFPAGWAKLLEREDIAGRVWLYDPLLVPMPLRTEDYAQHVEQEPVLGVGQIRRRLIGRSVPTAVVVGDAAIHRMVGGRSVFRDQLRWLIEIADSAHVSLRVLGFEASAPVVPYAFTVVSEEGADGPAAAFVEEPSDVRIFDVPWRSYLDLFDDLRDAARSEADSRRWIESVMGQA
ncbi:Scr1 family TA system antitoxin-like transcriptional regulator [Dactylosporangium sp. NPDC049742]|uniref:Scr1 family TA system antitoxin-like transcriptional regulator n=1 Tax=Dactylosporangium sp. NPDC049742 TaxID=3154737 RepID=UPI00342EA7D1